MENVTRNKCKTCGADLGDLFAKTDNGVVECPYCGSVWTVAKKQTSLEAIQFIAIGEHALDTCKFDDAFAAFKKAAELAPNEPQAHWGMALAEFKVQYLKDYVNNRMQPICHDINEKTFSKNKNYLAAINCATPEQKQVYKAKADEINDINDEFYRLKDTGLDYDCFICVKVSDGNGGRTKDYERAFDIYYYLKDSGYTPFFSEVVLKGQTGADYEAHILYALATSETLLVVCENEEYLTTPWVKNEYTRFLSMVADEQKEANTAAIIFSGKPIERLPGRKGKLQGIDYSKPTAMANIEKFVEEHTPAARARREQAASGKKEEDVSLLLDKARILCTREKYAEALELLENIIDRHPKCGEAFIGILAVHSKNFTLFDSKDIEKDIKVIDRFFVDKVNSNTAYADYIKKRQAHFDKKIEATNKLEYEKAVKEYQDGKYTAALERFEKIKGFADSAVFIKNIKKKLQEEERQSIRLIKKEQNQALTSTIVQAVVIAISIAIVVVGTWLLTTNFGNYYAIAPAAIVAPLVVAWIRHIKKGSKLMVIVAQLLLGGAITLANAIFIGFDGIILLISLAAYYLIANLLPFAEGFCFDFEKGFDQADRSIYITLSWLIICAAVTASFWVTQNFLPGLILAGDYRHCMWFVPLVAIVCGALSVCALWLANGDVISKKLFIDTGLVASMIGTLGCFVLSIIICGECATPIEYPLDWLYSLFGAETPSLESNLFITHIFDIGICGAAYFFAFLFAADA